MVDWCHAFWKTTLSINTMLERNRPTNVCVKVGVLETQLWFVLQIHEINKYLQFNWLSNYGRKHKRFSNSDVSNKG